MMTKTLSAVLAVLGWTPMISRNDWLIFPNDSSGYGCCERYRLFEAGTSKYEYAVSKHHRD